MQFWVLVLLPVTALGLQSNLRFDFTTNSTSYHVNQNEEIPQEFRDAQELTGIFPIPILRRIPEFNVTKLSKMNLSNCGVNDIEPGAFGVAPPIEYLYLDHNNLKVLKEGVFNYARLTHLNLSHNKISTLKKHTFDFIKTLETLILDHNDISTYELTFQDCPNLNLISIKWNFLDRLSENVFEHLKSNNLSLFFGYNKIQRLERDAFANTTFTELHFDHNDIYEMNDTMWSIGPCGLLDLNGNHLECLMRDEPMWRTVLRNVKKLSVLDNPLNCTCTKRMENIAREYKTELWVNKTLDNC